MASGIEEILTTLYEMVQDAWSLPLGADKCVLERDKVLDLLDEISNQLPGELKQAKTIVESRNDALRGTVKLIFQPDPATTSSPTPSARPKTFSSRPSSAPGR